MLLPLFLGLGVDKASVQERSLVRYNLGVTHLVQPTKPASAKPRPVGKTKPETQAQSAAYESWFTLGRNADAVFKISQKFSVDQRTVYGWMTKFNWWDRANKRIEEARKIAEPDRIAQVAKLLKDEYQTGELLRLKAVEHFSTKKIDKSSDAITAAVRGIELSRRALGLPNDVGQQQLEVKVTGQVDINEAALLAAMERILDDLDAQRDAGAAQGRSV